MDLSINGQSQVPPGFRFHPTEEELLQYYLRKKVSNEKIDLDVIREVDLNKLEPWDIQEKCRIGSAPQNDWYFFSHKDRKYPTGTRTNRATAAGFWKATGRDKMIYGGCRRVGLRKTLVFYKGRAPHGHKSEWIMHEYRLEESNQEQNYLASSVDINLPEEGWVVCRVFKKKNHQKGPNSPRSTSMPTASMDSKIQKLCSASNQTGVLNRILSYMGRTTCKVENETTLHLEHPEKNNNGNSGKDNNSSSSTNKYEFPHDHKAIHQERFILLPRLDSPDSTPPPAISSSSLHFDHHQYLPFEEMMLAEPEPAPSSYVTTTDNSELQSGSHGLSDWAALDQLVASQLNGQDEPTELARQFCCFGDNEEVDLHQLHQIQLNRLNNNQGLQVLGCESDFFWSNFMAKSSSCSSSTDPLRHLSL